MSLMSSLRLRLRRQSGKTFFRLHRDTILELCVRAEALENLDKRYMLAMEQKGFQMAMDQGAVDELRKTVDTLRADLRAAHEARDFVKSAEIAKTIMQIRRVLQE